MYLKSRAGRNLRRAVASEPNGDFWRRTRPQSFTATMTAYGVTCLWFGVQKWPVRPRQVW